MRIFYENRSRRPLFQGLSAEPSWATLAAVRAACAPGSYAKHEVIFHAGELRADALGVVLRGTVHIENLDLWGSKSILSSVSAGQAFAETYALVRRRLMMVDAVAAEECEVLFVNISAFSGARTRASGARQAAAPPAHGVHAQKPEPFAAHLLHHPQDRAGPSADLLFRTGRPQRQSGSSRCPFNRQQLADYLNLDRSALSKELCKMRDEGLLDL